MVRIMANNLDLVCQISGKRPNIAKEIQVL